MEIPVSHLLTANDFVGIQFLGFGYFGITELGHPMGFSGELQSALLIYYRKIKIPSVLDRSGILPLNHQMGLSGTECFQLGL